MALGISAQLDSRAGHQGAHDPWQRGEPRPGLTLLRLAEDSLHHQRCGDRDGGEPFTQAKVWIDNADGTLRQFETLEVSGITRLVTVTAVTPNAPVDAKLFSFKAPKGARIVDQTVLGGR